MLLEGEWDFQGFLRDQLQDYLQQTHEFMLEEGFALTGEEGTRG
jgi:hypothetical protein